MSKVTITEGEYEHLLSRDRFLQALEQTGVKNWEYYPVALELFDEEILNDLNNEDNDY